MSMKKIPPRGKVENAEGILAQIKSLPADTVITLRKINGFLYLTINGKYFGNEGEFYKP